LLLDTFWVSALPRIASPRRDVSPQTRLPLSARKSPYNDVRAPAHTWQPAAIQKWVDPNVCAMAAGVILSPSSRRC